MSLFVGNLSEHTRRDELERVFRRFGHCNLKLKREGYGFVVFDFPPNAAKALRALKGRNICGEPLTLTWSNKQPRNFQRFARGGRELQRARNSDRLGYARRKGDFNGWRNCKTGNVGRGRSVDVPSEERGFHQDDFNDYVGLEKDIPDDGGGVIPNLDGNGRWGELIHDPSVDSGNENAIEFDRYEPYRGYDRKHENENHHIGYSGSSPAANSQENVSRAQIGDETSNRPIDPKYQPTCYRCGDSGHKMRNCPTGHSSQRKYDRLDTLPIRNQRNKGRVSGSRHYHMSLRNESSTVAKETDRHPRKEYGGKKRSRNEIETPKRSRVKISRGSISSSLPSDYSASRSLSNSQSSKSLSRPSFHSRSRSASSKAHASSSQLRSSKSQHCRGRSLKSRRSSSPTSLSVSLGQLLPSSPNQIQLNLKTTSIDATAIESADHLVAQGQQIDSTMELDNCQSTYTGIVVNGSAAVHATVVDAMGKDQYVLQDNTVNHIVLSPSNGVTIDGNLSPQIVKETEGFRHSGTLMMDDIPTEIQKPASETHANHHSGLSTIICPEEMCVVLKNYGLELPKDDEKNLTMDAFFGCARLWPWHIIYYRRLKKGPISTENYARRVAQNQEFDIVDKYIRSSSGWGELSLENS